MNNSLIVMENSGGIPYCKPKECVLTDPYKIKYNEIGFVHLSSLVDIINEHSRIMVAMPAPCRAQKEYESDKKCAGWPRVSFGIYWSADHLLLIEDIEEWCHGFIGFDKIRNIYDLKKELTVKAEYAEK
jgi:hypothetical protein